MSQIAQRFTRVPTRFGELVVLWTLESHRPLVREILLPTPRAAALPLQLGPECEIKPGEHPNLFLLVQQIAAFCAGVPVDFSLDNLDLEQCRPFHKRVLLADFAIPRGSVTTYGLLARYVGAPGAARAVGSAMANNPFPLVIPCHRTIGSDGHLRGFGGGLPMKRSLLEMEGIQLSPAGRVVNPRWYYLG